MNTAQRKRRLTWRYFWAASGKGTSVGRSRVWENLLVLGVLLGAVLAYYVNLWRDRPMFHNSFGLHHRAPVFYWRPDMPYYDMKGNVARADYELNLLVLFLVGGADVHPARFLFAHEVDGGVQFPSLTGADERLFFTPIRRDTAIIFTADEAHEALPLPEGEARRLDASIRWHATDLEVLAQALRRRYGVVKGPP